MRDIDLNRHSRARRAGDKVDHTLDKPAEIDGKHLGALATEASPLQHVERADDHAVDERLRKGQFSGGYATNLAVLLFKPGASRLIPTGLATHIRVPFTAGTPTCATTTPQASFGSASPRQRPDLLAPPAFAIAQFEQDQPGLTRHRTQ